MDLRIQGKLALVTGSTQGIGKAIAVQLLQEGAQVIVNGRSQARVNEVTQELQSIGTVYGVAADISTAAGSKQLIEAIRAIGAVEILINNVGFFEFKPFFKVTDAEWHQLFDLNVMSGVWLTRLLMPDMLKRNWGRIVFIASEAGVKPNPDMIHYSVTKTTQIALARGLAEMTKGTGVTVNSALVAPTWTEGVEVFLDKIAQASGTTVEAMKTDYFKADGVTSLLQRFATVDEISDLVVFLCSENASAINGSAQRVDGGIVRSIL
ncbi:MAG: SDR family NAD(P)-dependent oxidoreductase [Oculatellaceae cyanobacterium Prado106]|nr:SDR family NAD(P)-dependent oxidoreductase [Oculatellaceae cyanobacterium Prado106]